MKGILLVGMLLLSGCMAPYGYHREYREHREYTPAYRVYTPPVWVSPNYNMHDYYEHREHHGRGHGHGHHRGHHDD